MKYLLLLTSLITISVQASVPSLDNLSQDDLNNISKEFSANFVHTTVSGAASKGVFGFEAGLLGGLTSTPDIEAKVRETSPNTKVNRLYHAALFGTLSIPFGLTFEGSFLPEQTLSDISVKNYSGAIKWTLTDVFLSWLPLSLAIKAHAAFQDISYQQVINNSSTAFSNINSEVNFESRSMGAMAMASMKLLIFEPYAGIGFVNYDADLSLAASSGTIFDFTTAQTAGSDGSSTHFVLGTEIKMLLFRFGIEYNRVFDTDRYSTKLSVAF